MSAFQHLLKHGLHMLAHNKEFHNAVGKTVNDAGDNLKKIFKDNSKK